MKAKTYLAIPIALMILFLLPLGTVYAQGRGPITAEVDRTALSTDETLTLTVILNTAAWSAPDPTLPSLQGFYVAGRSSSSQVSIVNGAVSSQLVYVYRLQPYQAGDLVIEPINVTLDGQTFSTEPITVHVTQGTGASPSAPSSAPPAGQPAPASSELAGQDVFIEAEVDNPAPYLGQQVVYTFRLYQAVNLGQPHYEAPAFTGFWSENQTDQEQYQVQAANRIYQVTELRTVLFPSIVGPVTIEPARLTSPGSFFRSGVNLQTQPVTLEVQPLPPNAPDSFNGAVGQFTLTSEVDTTQGKVNEPLTWQVTLSGQGYLNGAPDPLWPEMPDWRDFESQATINTQVQDGQVSGSRVYERLLVPGLEGEFTIPPLEYTYFDPIAGEYRTLTTQPIPVSIAPGAAEAPTTLVLSKETVEQVATDIRHLKPAPPQLNLADRPVTGRSLYWLTWGLPLFGLVGYYGWQRRQRYWQNNRGLARSSQARRKAKKSLAQARKQRQDVYSAAGLILTTYLADKLNQPVAGLTHQALADLLTEKGVKPDLVERVEACLVSSELGRFAPGADNPGHAKNLLQETDRLISNLEKVL